MIGIVIVAHGRLAKALIEACEFIVGRRLEAIGSVDVIMEEAPKALKARIGQTINQVKGDDGCLVLVDMFGGSPSDMSLSFLEPGQVEILTGINLPMLLHVVMARAKLPNLSDLAREAEIRGAESIALAGRILNP